MTSKLDIIVLGATGYTGAITCRHLNTQKTLNGRWGIAGRNASKLKELKESLSGDIPSFVVDLSKPSTIDEVCKKTVCLISCAGPFTKIGMPVVEACLRNRTHYVDSTGEFPFVRLVAERFHAEAVEKGVVVVSCCGFDSVPSDLGNYVVHEQAKEELKEVRCYFRLKASGISCGTANSIGAAGDSITWKDMDACSLVPADGPRPRWASTRVGIWYENGRFVAPFFMASCNERVVRRTNSLIGSTAAYSEAVEGSFLQMLGTAIGSILAMAVVSMSPLRRFLISRYYPAEACNGPTAEEKKNSQFHCTFIGTTASNRRIETLLSAKQDMYDVTGVFLVACARSAVALASKKSIKPGVLTPASAFGPELERYSVDGGVMITTIMGSKKQN